MLTPSPSPRHMTDTNGSLAYTPRTPLSAKRSGYDSSDVESDSVHRQRDVYSNQQLALREQRAAEQEKLLKAVAGKFSIHLLLGICSAI